MKATCARVQLRLALCCRAGVSGEGSREAIGEGAASSRLESPDAEDAGSVECLPQTETSAAWS